MSHVLAQVARLSRPQRIRCRPALAALPGRSAALLLARSLRPLHGLARMQNEDAKMTAEMQRLYPEPGPEENQRKARTKRQGLPSLKDRKAALKPAGHDDIDALEAGASSRSVDALVEPAPEPATPKTKRASRKGKEKALVEAPHGSELPSLLGRRAAPLLSVGHDGEHYRDSTASTEIQPEEQAFPPSSSQDPASSPKPRASRKGKEKAEDVDETVSNTRTSLRRNPVGVQMLSKSLHSQLFPGEPLPRPPQSLVGVSRNHLHQHGLSPDGAAVLPEINFLLPRLRGNNLREHFYTLGRETAEPYLSMARELSAAELPPTPTAWQLERSGWTKYHSDGRQEAVEDLGDERIVSFDVETLYKISPYPVMATAASPTAWYSWLSPALFQDAPTSEGPKPPIWDRRIPSHHPRDLIPLFPSTGAERLVIGHNVGYDRARVKEEYSLDRTSTRWLDTLSLHVSTRGITSVQRPAWLKYRKNKLEKVERDAEAIAAMRETAEAEGDPDMLASLDAFGESSDLEALQKRWEDVTSVNSLAEVARLHCGTAVDKTIRNRFADDSVTHASQLRPELGELLDYCASDVRVTHEVYQKVFALYLASCPHPASFAGVLAMGNAFLPVDDAWERYLKDAETKYKEMDDGVRKALRVLADKLMREGKRDGDAWAEQLDWTPKKARWGEGGPIEGGGTAASTASIASSIPQWQANLPPTTELATDTKFARSTLPLLLQLTYKSHPVTRLAEHQWCFLVPEERFHEYTKEHGEPVQLGEKDTHPLALVEGKAIFRVAHEGEARKAKLTGTGAGKMVKTGELVAPDMDLLKRLCGVGGTRGDLGEAIQGLVQTMRQSGRKSVWGQQLDWTGADDASVLSTKRSIKKKSPTIDHGTWPKWYWDLTGPATSEKVPFGTLDLTTKRSVAPLLLRLQWQGYPLFYSREHKWLYRVPGTDPSASSRGEPIQPETPEGHLYFRLPHKDGEGHNVGNPLAKSFVKYIESGELASAAAAEGDEDDVTRRAAADATNMNVLCSYWISSRERIMGQMVVYEDEARTRGMILPQVITMGTVTRRAVEATWLTASNAKKNRVGSELKAMVRAPEGYSLVGADVDSEELWISSVMGDSQFGLHGATAIGWMTLEGTKSAGTDLHSKTASILGISRDAAKVFNYSRIYGAGQKHAVQLLLQGDSTLSQADAAKRAAELYKQTKGSKARRGAQLPPAAAPTIWHGGSESFLFNTLEAIALSNRPTTPALGCGITRALRKSYLEEDSSYLPSRINWVVQSSGVDYLHLLIVSMEYLIKRYGIQARYLISVHDEVRYLAKEQDRYRTALALQIANAWTRALFCYNLGMDDVPQGVAFFSAVDVDRVLRKEVFMGCETPSHPQTIPAGESLEIGDVLEKTGGTLGREAAATINVAAQPDIDTDIDLSSPPVRLFRDIASVAHARFLEAQANAGGAAAKRWLNAQEALVGYDDVPLGEAKVRAKAKARGRPGPVGVVPGTSASAGVGVGAGAGARAGVKHRVAVAAAQGVFRAAGGR